MNLPIYRGKKIDSDEWVEGMYVPYDYDWDSDGEIVDYDYILQLDGEYKVKVDPETLAISFDNGIRFDSFSFVSIAIDDRREDI